MKIHRMKDLAILIEEVAEATGYAYEFLAACVMELLEDGESAEEAFNEVRGIAYEHDY